MRIQKHISIRGFLIDPISKSPNQHYKNCMANSKENIITNEIWGVKG